MYLCLCTFCINYYITLNEVILVCFVYFSILHIYSIITIIITLVIYSQIAVMWTTNTEPKGSDLPEPNHCALLVPRQWSTGLRIYNPCPKASVVDPVPEPSDPSTPAPDPSDVDSVQPAEDSASYRMIDPQIRSRQVDKRRGSTKCGATVVQIGDNFVPGRHRIAWNIRGCNCSIDYYF